MPVTVNLPPRSEHFGAQTILSENIFKQRFRYSTIDKPYVLEMPDDVGLKGCFSAATPIEVINHLNGFALGILNTFAQNNHLVLRPGDVWLAILGQLSLYINNNNEARQMFLVEDYNVPVEAVIVIGTLHTVFEFSFTYLNAGFASVTLLGERQDWVEILQKIENLGVYGEQTAKWTELLKPIIERMVKCFDEPDSWETREFWFGMVTHEEGDNLVIWGWITAFCFWGSNGECRYPPFQNEIHDIFSSVKTILPMQYMLDGVLYHSIGPMQMPSTTISVPMTALGGEVQDIGATFLSGAIAMSIEKLEDDGREVTLEPMKNSAGFCVFTMRLGDRSSLM